MQFTAWTVTMGKDLEEPFVLLKGIPFSNKKSCWKLACCATQSTSFSTQVLIHVLQYRILAICQSGCSVSGCYILKWQNLIWLFITDLGTWNWTALGKNPGVFYIHSKNMKIKNRMTCCYFDLKLFNQDARS